MKLSASTLAVVFPAFVVFSGHAAAACTGPALNAADLTSTLTGKTVCTSRGSERWQEFHGAAGNLIDYKQGPNSRTDPSETVGTWSIVANGGGNAATVVYNYGSGGTFSYSIRANGGASYSFCGVQNFEVTLIAGQTACGN